MSAIGLLPIKLKDRILGAAKSIKYSQVDEISPEEKLLTREFNYILRRQEFRKNDLNTKRPKLAYFSPLPSVKSGISYYSTVLIPSLVKYYKIDVIIDQKGVDQKAMLDNGCVIRDLSWFAKHGGEYDRIIYQVGNSSCHAYMMEVMKLWPGVVVLHDFYLGHLIRSIDALQPGLLLDNLYTGWGFTALHKYSNDLNIENLVLKNPLNAKTFQYALGVIVHSESSQRLTSSFFNIHGNSFLHRVPLVRKMIPAKRTVAEIRKKHSIPDDAFVCCSFGYASPYKVCHRIIDSWVVSSLNDNKNCWLIIVGELDPGKYGSLVNYLIKQSGNPRILVTGWLSEDIYIEYLSATNIAVQLRTDSRGETSASVLDCMAYGVPTIINTHGSMAELPDDIVLKIPDKFIDANLSDALEKLFHSNDFRTSLGGSAKLFSETGHEPNKCSRLYFDAIESIYKNKERTWSYFDSVIKRNPETGLSNLMQTPGHSNVNKIFNPCYRPQLLVDVSAIIHADLKTGIQRVVRAQLLALMANPPAGYRVEPVYLHKGKGGWRYFYARSYGFSLLEMPDFYFLDEKVNFSPNDTLYIADYSPTSYLLACKEKLYSNLKSEIGEIHVLVYDILPITHPQYFPDASVERHKEWLESVSEIADQLIFISCTVANEYRRWRENSICKNLHKVKIAVNHLGADICASKPSTGFGQGSNALLKKMSSSPTFLMVGTIEPRKGYLDVLEEFEKLWVAGEDVNLIIVGNEGWKSLPKNKRKSIPKIINRLKKSPFRNKNLFWLNGISDEYLETVYARSACLIAASIDEGFGLPLIEASAYNVPIIARDIPIFREIAGDFATYFGGSQKPLHLVLLDWLAEYQQGKGIKSNEISVRTWFENIETLKELLGFTHKLGNPPIYNRFLK